MAQAVQRVERIYQYRYMYNTNVTNCVAYGIVYKCVKSTLFVLCIISFAFILLVDCVALLHAKKCIPFKKINAAQMEYGMQTIMNCRCCCYSCGIMHNNGMMSL